MEYVTREERYPGVVSCSVTTEGTDVHAVKALSREEREKTVSKLQTTLKCSSFLRLECSLTSTNK